MPDEWVTISEAARRLQVTRAAVRGRVRRGTLEQRRERQGNRERPLVRLPEGYQELSLEPHQEPHQGRSMVPPPAAAPDAALIAELATLRERVAGLERERDTLRTTWERERTELRTELERARALAEAERERVDRLLSALAERRQPEQRVWPGRQRWWRRLWRSGG